MIYDLQRASLWKRVSAWLLDAILLCVTATMMAWILSLVLNYDGYQQQFDARCAYFEAEYGVSRNVTQAEIDAMTPEELSIVEAASTALASDSEALYAWNMMIYLIIIMVSIGLLLAYLLLEFAVPLLLKNGQTIGKEIFGVAVMRTDGIRVNGVCMFIRTVLGKFAIETMIPIMMLLMLYFGAIGLAGLLIAGGIILLEVMLLMLTKDHSMIHDKLANTVTVDLASQLIFDTPEALIAYKQKIAAEKAAQQSY